MAFKCFRANGIKNFLNLTGLVSLDAAKPRKLVDEILELGDEIFGSGAVETIKECLQCGRCTGSCPSGRVTALRTRKVFLLSLLNLRERLLSADELWLCTTCYTCYERCPRKVKTTDIIRIVRNIAAREGYMADAHKRVAALAIKTGHAVPIDEATREQRRKLGLTEVPPTTQTHEAALKELQEIVRMTGFDKLVGFDWAKMDV
ncbi:CoB--CoM heterodisulfide reductase subunit C [Candidatus Alkanophaga liquidiphilum]